MENVLSELEESIRGKRITIGMSPRMYKEFLKEYIVIPSK
jgi:hypothetical protein